LREAIIGLFHVDRLWQQNHVSMHYYSAAAAAAAVDLS